jgi:hypothetical protein
VHRVTAGDRGAAIVLLALTLVALMVMAAFAIDYGAVTNERRQAQTAADAAALAGGGQLLAGHSRSDATAEVVDASSVNLGTGLTLVEWRTRWQTDCSDPGRPAGYVPSTLSPCISFNAYNTRIRVQLPSLTVNTQFAPVIGIDELHTSAFAEAELVPTGFGRVLPFGVPSAGSGAVELCLKSGQKPDGNPPCSGPVEGNFGSVDISLFGNPAMGTPQYCGNVDPNLKLQANIILGSDHPLDEWSEAPPDPLDPSPETIRDDHTLCPDLGARPNRVWAQTGVGSSLDGGLVAGTVLDGRTLAGRLTLGPEADRVVRFGAPPLDDRPLWEYIPSSLTAGIPASCLRSTFTGAAASRAHMATCIADYTAGGFTAELFTEDADTDGVVDLLATPRFGFVPLFHPNGTIETLTTGTSSYLIKRFVPVFLQTTYFACNPGGCAGVFEPGEIGQGLPVSSNRKADALTAIVLPPSAVPAAALSLAPGGVVIKDLALRR